MDRLKLLDAGLQAFDVNLPDVVAPLCVATRYRASTCRRCLDVCPGKAIATQPWLEIDPGRCTSCGACAVACRTGALTFGAQAGLLRERLRLAANGGAARVRVACRRTALGESEADQRSHAVLAVRCLGGVSAGDLVAAAALGFRTVELVDGGCNACPDGLAGAAADGVVDAARDALEAVGTSLLLTRIVDAVDGERPWPIDKAIGGDATLSRRGLFAYVAHGLRRTAAGAATPEKPSIQDLHAQAPPPAARTRLLVDLTALAARAQVADASLPTTLPFARVNASAACDGCGLCLRYCPHDALAPAVGRVACDQGRCSGCGLCAESCPREALTLAGGTVPAGLATTTTPALRT